jgi:hypothetical protein
MDPTASASRRSSITLRCDPWVPVVARFAFCVIAGVGLIAYNDDIVVALVGFAMIVIGLWWMIAWLASSLTVDSADNQVMVNRLTSRFTGTGSSRVVPRDAIDAVVLARQLRYGSLLLPSRIELRLKNGEKIPVSNISSLMGGMAEHGQLLADTVNCGYEEQEAPDRR